MAVGLTDGSIGSKTVAYLHTSRKLKYKDWNAEVKTTVEKFLPDKQRELEKLLNNTEELEKKVKTLKENISKITGEFNKKIGKHGIKSTIVWT